MQSLILKFFLLLVIKNIPSINVIIIVLQKVTIAHTPTIFLPSIRNKYIAIPNAIGILGSLKIAIIEAISTKTNIISNIFMVGILKGLIKYIPIVIISPNIPRKHVYSTNWFLFLDNPFINKIPPSFFVFLYECYYV
ncbi:MAG: hypothetical protein PHF46_02390 [Candidatus Gracilibacteria bacterium]|nr:hypothetical protein [Candidatus Gracilibacteria bacterium]MDD3120231.1 hypothetical protein [Candidatus Gracilibacteria bacterium]